MHKIIELYNQSVDAAESRPLFKCLDLRSERLSGASLSCSDWIECDLRDSIFVDCDLRGACFLESDLRNTRFEGCSMFGCELPNIDSIECIDCTIQL